MKKILLTGGSGFIGRNIKESYLSQKYEIVAPRSSELNLLDTDNVDIFFANKQFDVVLHAAVKPGHRNAKDPANLFYSNVRIFENLERHKDKFGKFINFGSGAIYDISKDISNVKEEDIFLHVPKDEHGFCKYTVAKQIENLDNFVDLNIFGIFGKYEDWKIRFISNAICKALYGLPITIRQNRKFSYLWIEELMPILEYFIENKSQYKSYNIVPDKKSCLLDLAKLVRDISGRNIEIEVAKEGMGLEYNGNNQRLKDEFKNIIFTDLKIAIEKLYSYYEANRNIIDKNKLKHDK
ncbi:MAG: NAD-dependent epimerase/dehydratase family protein [Endomicrobium sp.]|nr:NAD-dependent epimerase/dehydratase family protein [Endomicrobium sp.]